MFSISSLRVSIYAFVTLAQKFTCSLKNNNTKEIHAKVVADLAKLSILASPTEFHYMLQDLQKKKTLLRCYSQNIDGLESKVGFNIDATLDLSNQCIPLHGSLHYLCCTVCASTHLLQNYHTILASGHFPSCPLCQQKQDQRSVASHRPRQIGQLRPDIVLYGEDHPQGEAIAAAHEHDLTLDLLLVVGTSLKVPGTAKLVKELSKQLHNNGLGHSFYINETAPAKDWLNIFDIFLEGDCQAFAKMLRNSMGTLSSPVPNPDEKENNCSAAAYLQGLEARQDFRPSWRWI